MAIKYRVRLNLEHLEDRCVPTTATLSNGVLTVLGDNHGNNSNVFADSSGNIHVTERGQQVTIKGGTATTSDVTLVVEEAGTGNNNTLATAASLGSIANDLIGNGGGVAVFAPGNNAPSTAYGSPDAAAVNHFLSNPGGKDVFHGGLGRQPIRLGAGHRHRHLHRRRQAQRRTRRRQHHRGRRAGLPDRRLPRRCDFHPEEPCAVPLTTTGIQDWSSSRPPERATSCASAT